MGKLCDSWWRAVGEEKTCQGATRCTRVTPSLRAQAINHWLGKLVGPKWAAFQPERQGLYLNSLAAELKPGPPLGQAEQGEVVEWRKSSVTPQLREGSSKTWITLAQLSDRNDGHWYR